MEFYKCVKIKYKIIIFAFFVLSVYLILPAMAADKSAYYFGGEKQTFSSSTTEVQAGHYDHQFLQDTFTTFTAANISSGVTIFGVAGTYGVQGASPPTLTTNSATNIGTFDATCGGNISSNGGESIIERGICWATTSGPTRSTGFVSIEGGTGTGSYNCSMSNLSPLTTYYVRAWATNSKGISYGNEVNFTTLSIGIGASYGGGIVVYADAYGHGIIAATMDASGRSWSGSAANTGASGTAVYTGKSNTDKIIATHGTDCAAYNCRNYGVGGYTDWYMPSFDELTAIWNNRSYLSGLNTSGIVYLPSTENGQSQCYGIFFNNGASNNNFNKTYGTRAVRAVRSF